MPDLLLSPFYQDRRAGPSSEIYRGLFLPELALPPSTGAQLSPPWQGSSLRETLSREASLLVVCLPLDMADNQLKCELTPTSLVEGKMRQG